MRVVSIFIVFLYCAIVGASSLYADDITAEKIYTSYNMWYEKPYRMHCINYKVGKRIPAGSIVSTAKLIKEIPDFNGPGDGSSSEEQYIVFTLAGDDQEYKVYFVRRYHPRKNIDDYFKLMFSGQPLDERMSGFSEEEKEAVRGGYLVAGMSRDAVLISYGYPPEHKTTNLESDSWVYWINRFKKKFFHFIPEGKTIKKEEVKASGSKSKASDGCTNEMIIKLVRAGMSDEDIAKLCP